MQSTTDTSPPPCIYTTLVRKFGKRLVDCWATERKWSPDRSEEFAEVEAEFKRLRRHCKETYEEQGIRWLRAPVAKPKARTKSDRQRERFGGSSDAAAAETPLAAEDEDL